MPGVGGKKRQRLGALDALLDREDWAPLRDELRSTLLLLSPEREWGLRTMGGGRECESDRPSELAYKLLLLHTLRRHIVGSAAASSASLFSEFPVAHRFVDILLSLPATTVLFELKQVPAHLVVQAGRPEHLAALHRLAPERLRELWVRPYGEDTDYTVRHYASRVHRRQLLPYWRTLRDSCLTGRSAVQRRLRTPGHRVLLVTLVFLGANSYAHIVRTSLTEGDGPTPEEELSALLRQQCTIIGEEGRRAP